MISQAADLQDAQDLTISRSSVSRCDRQRDVSSTGLALIEPLWPDVEESWLRPSVDGSLKRA
jgi:hypothetical protein